MVLENGHGLRRSSGSGYKQKAPWDWTGRPDQPPGLPPWCENEIESDPEDLGAGSAESRGGPEPGHRLDGVVESPGRADLGNP